MMKLFSLFAAISLCWVSVRADELPWQDDYAKTLAEAAEKHQPVLLDFSASWCGPCRMMETTTFADAGVREAMKGYLLVKVNLDQAHDLATRYRVEAIPTCILLNQFGETVAENTGYLNPEVFKLWLGANVDAAFAQQSKADGLTAVFKSLDARLEAADEKTRAEAITELATRYCAPAARNDGSFKLAEEEWRAWFKRHPDRAAPLLNEPRLAVRILFATLFADKLGNAFQFDPWDPAATRAAAVERATVLLNTPSP